MWSSLTVPHTRASSEYQQRIFVENRKSIMWIPPIFFAGLGGLVGCVPDW